MIINGGMEELGRVFTLLKSSIIKERDSFLQGCNWNMMGMKKVGKWRERSMRK